MKIRLMSHNQWKQDVNLPAWEEMGMDCSATARVRGFVRVFRDTQPDIIGCQEVSFTMADKLIRYSSEEGLNYALLWGRDTPIVYRPDKFELVDSAFHLYSEEFPGHTGSFNNNKTKSYTAAVFRVKETGSLFIFLTTHLWWKSGNPNSGYYQEFSNEAREYQMGLVVKKIDELREKYNCPAIVVGDLNAEYDSLAVKKALSNGFVHAHDVATDFADETMGYHSCGKQGYAKEYKTGKFENAIDHILIKGAPDGFVRRFERFSPEYYLPLSDHSPVFIDIEI